jgi:hypothetical protein
LYTCARASARFWSRMRRKPWRQSLRLTIGPQGDRLSSFQVNQHGTIDLPLPVGPVVDAEPLGCGKAWRARSWAASRTVRRAHRVATPGKRSVNTRRGRPRWRRKTSGRGAATRHDTSDVEVVVRPRVKRIPAHVRQELDRLKALYDGFHDRELAHPVHQVRCVD